MDNTTRQAWNINKYLWMTLAGVGIYLPVAEVQGLLSVPVGIAWLVFGIALVNGAARSLLGFRHGGALSEPLTALFNLIDIGMVSLAIGITRGIESDLWLLYFVFMSFEAFYATPSQKRLLDIAVIIAYLFATLPDELRSYPPPVPLPVFARLLTTRLFFLILVSALGRRTFAQAAERNQELTVLREATAAGDERARIAREVHDSLGHALVSVILRLELASRLIRKAPDEAEAILKEEIPALRSAWNEGRDLAFHLRPWERDWEAGDNLPTVLRRHIARFAERTGLRVEFKEEEGEWKLRPAISFAVTRIVQEALTNVAKHAVAQAVEVRLMQERERIVVRIADDGQGFDPTKVVESVGLRAMHERAEGLGGSLHLSSSPNNGTEIEVRLPR